MTRSNPRAPTSPLQGGTFPALPYQLLPGSSAPPWCCRRRLQHTADCSQVRKRFLWSSPTPFVVPRITLPTSRASALSTAGRGRERGAGAVARHQGLHSAPRPLPPQDVAAPRSRSRSQGGPLGAAGFSLRFLLSAPCYGKRELQAQESERRERGGLHFAFPYRLFGLSLDPPLPCLGRVLGRIED